MNMKQNTKTWRDDELYVAEARLKWEMHDNELQELIMNQADKDEIARASKNMQRAEKKYRKIQNWFTDEYGYCLD